MNLGPLHSVYGGSIHNLSAGKMKIIYPKTRQEVKIEVDYEYLAKAIETYTPVQDDLEKVVIISNPENVRICSQNSSQEIKIPREAFLSYIS